MPDINTPNNHYDDLGGQKINNQEGSLYSVLISENKDIIEFSDHFPRCLLQNEYSMTDKAVEHIYQLYPNKSDEEILAWLLSFEKDKKLFPKIQDIINCFSAKVTSQKLLKEKQHIKGGYKYCEAQYNFYKINGD